MDHKYTIDNWVSRILKATGNYDAFAGVSGRNPSSDFTVESIMSKMEDDTNSQKSDLSQIKAVIQMLVNNKGHRNSVASPPGTLKPPDPTGDGEA